MTTPETPSAPRRRLRYFLISAAAFAVTVAIFYAEEDWRGWRAMEKCKHELAAQGVSLDWASQIPAAVPDNENVFGVPEISNWFVRKGMDWENDLTPKFHNPAWDSKERTIVAHLMIGLPGTTPPAGFVGLALGDKNARAEMVRLLKETIGPVAIDPSGLYYTKEPPGEIRPVQIYLQCQNQPGEKVLKGFLPRAIVSDDSDYFEGLQAQTAGDGSYNVTIRTPMTAAEFLKLNEELEPVFALIRNALQRPYARIGGDYNSGPSEISIPNYVMLRTVSQRLSAMARCHLLLGHPEKALGDLTLIRDMCRRLLEENKPMTLVSAMINVALSGLYVRTIADGLGSQAWQDPQLAALEDQLKQINLLSQVQLAVGGERFSLCYHLSTDTPGQFFKLTYGGFSGGSTNAWSVLKEQTEIWIQSSLIPRGWLRQNLVTGANFFGNVVASMDPASKIILPNDLEGTYRQFDEIFSHWSPYTFAANIFIPNFERAFKTTARNQASVNQGRIVCALERFRLAHGEYPETLAALVPQLVDAIPHDVIGGQPPHYRRNADGTFLLYSIGWSQKDHGGRTGDPNDFNNGQTNCDMVWPEK